ncbi:MAG TPA: cyclic nucleotide-binding domain-containing protein [Candidatus Limnocylindria bacterium]|nr:cyclic nucleotide-binding domain-containing protein [Candidatus Limnocylindria bacterium]
MTERAAPAAELGAGWFGAGLSPHALARLADCCTAATTYDADAVIMREGAQAEPFGIVAQGRVALRLLVPERGSVTIMTVETGDVVGWSALVPPYRSTSTAVAVEPTRLLAFDVKQLRQALREDPALAATIYPRVLEAVARRLSATRHQLLDLYTHDAERVPW